MTRFATSMDVSSEVHSTGAPAKSAPRAVENGSQAWRLGAAADGPRQVRLVARQIGDDQRHAWHFSVKDSTSPSEAVLLGLADGVDRIRQLGATSVTVVVTDPTLYGYVWRRWEVHSLRMHAALAALDRATLGLEVTFEPGRKFR